jgi:hypothetical protein
MKNKKIVARSLCVIVAGLILITLLVLCTGCNQTIIDLNYKFDRAIIEMPGGEVVEIELKEWGDYDGEQLQLIAKDGTVYLVSSNNCVLIND